MQYSYRPTSWVNENDYINIKNRFLNDLNSTQPVTSNGRTLKQLINDSLKNRGMNISQSINNINNSINGVNTLNRKASKFLNNIDYLKKFQDNYSKKLENILESKYQGTLNNKFDLNQKITEKKIKTIKDTLNHLGRDINNSSQETSDIFRSIRCLDNDLTLNVEAVAQNNVTTKDGFYMIYINDNILFYELTNITESQQQCTSRIRNVCEYRCTDGSNNNLQFDTAYNQNLSDAYFKIIIINNYNDYNSHINAHKKTIFKKFAYETDDINYPFYIIQPKNHPGNCVNFEIDNDGNFHVRVKPCSNVKTERFEAKIYESNIRCAETNA